MFVYVLNKHGKPLMPCQPRKAKILLRDGKAKVVKREPFTIQLKFGSSGYRQKISLGIDAGSKHVGASASTEKQELYASQTELRGGDIVKLLSTKRELRRSRRNRKTRYRKPRFPNRISRKHKGWLAPSIENKIATHLRVVADICKMLPISNIAVETASFDIQKIKNPEISGEEYQQGEQLGFWNVSEFVLHRDNHEFQCGHGKSKDHILNVHHIESRKTGGDAPNNLITLCETCHTGYHRGTVKLPKTIHRGMRFRDAAFMGIMRWAFYERLKKLYDNVHMTFGYITKNKRIKHKIAKTHTADAFCIAGNLEAEHLPYFYLQKQTRRHNRQIHKQKVLRGGKRKMNQAPYLVRGFRLFDKVKFAGQECFVFGRRMRGYFSLRKLSGEVVATDANCRKIKFLQPCSRFICERREAALLPMAKARGTRADEI